MVTQQADGTTEFRFFRPDAAEMFLVGDFNSWQPSAVPMAAEPGGFWRCRLSLSEGLYRFRYRSGDQWYVDYAAFGVECGPYGHDSMLRVERKQITCLDAD
jgi:1,4-alpha-glucan branching enzyme